ncbi:hypothetical protein [Roseibium sediminis]|uniref:hypothetical protein n=1 Tax=Roseibium sediminis TaxID=1775174 RepID=UPI00123E3BDC|nr:hypothetical protein [Roseibium sediminis]
MNLGGNGEQGGNGAQDGQGTPNGNGGNGDAFLSTLSENNRSFAQEQGFQNPDAVFDGYRSLQEQLNGAVKLPGADATPDQHSEFYKQVSGNWTPQDGYQFKMPDGLPENFAYDQEFATEAGGWFKEAGLHPIAAQALHDKWVGKMAELQGQSLEAAEQAAQQQAEAVESAHRELVKEYGDPNSDGYKNLVAKADRANKALNDKGLDLSAWFAEKGILTDPDDQGAQQVADPIAVKLLAFIHDNAFSEDSLNGLAGAGGGNPFDKTNPDLAKQNELIRTNPDKAKRLIEQAGRDPKTFYLS